MFGFEFFLFCSLGVFFLLFQLFSIEEIKTEKNAKKKGLLVYDAIYGSTTETANWIKAIIGHDQHLDVKALNQVITVDPYDYVIVGSLTRWEKPSKKIYAFVEKHKDRLSQKQVCYFLNCGDTDETMILKAPGQKAHLIAGRNYLIDIKDKYPRIKPVAVAGFGGRQVMPNLNKLDTFFIWMVGKLAKEGASWEGLDIWESLVPERVEAFGNEIRTRILGLEPLSTEALKPLRGYWESLQPGNLEDPAKKKYKPRTYDELQNTGRIYYLRTRAKGELSEGLSGLKKWADDTSISLKEQVTTFYNSYYHAVKNYNGKGITIHAVVATLPEDPGYCHFSFRIFEKPADRKGAEEDILKAKEIIKAFS